MAGGSGITPETANELFSAGVDVITSGDHLWDQKEVSKLLESEPRFLRPVNYPPEVPGRGCQCYQLEGQPVFAVLNVQGRVFMPPLENPFSMAQAEVERVRQQNQNHRGGHSRGSHLGKKSPWPVFLTAG